jgi:nitroimidazol reductase NimA-like FMN-containing flavoprotein (pyridoxamine 5'-phosphate oxidase superfamily)
MAMEVDRNGLQVLHRAECLRLLRHHTLGRVGLTFGALPTVLPVNYFLDGDRILVRTGSGSKLDAAMRDMVVAFEVDDFDPVYHSGWSVVVTGVATEITEAEDLEALNSARVARWAPRGEEHVLAISTEMVSGRRLMDGGVAPAR